MFENNFILLFYLLFWNWISKLRITEIQGSENHRIGFFIKNFILFCGNGLFSNNSKNKYLNFNLLYFFVKYLVLF
jgi:hypothetical protein